MAKAWWRHGPSAAAWATSTSSGTARALMARLLGAETGLPCSSTAGAGVVVCTSLQPCFQVSGSKQWSVGLALRTGAHGAQYSKGAPSSSTRNETRSISVFATALRKKSLSPLRRRCDIMCTWWKCCSRMVLTLSTSHAFRSGSTSHILGKGLVDLPLILCPNWVRPMTTPAVRLALAEYSSSVSFPAVQHNWCGVLQSGCAWLLRKRDCHQKKYFRPQKKPSNMCIYILYI